MNEINTQIRTKVEEETKHMNRPITMIEVEDPISVYSPIPIL